MKEESKEQSLIKGSPAPKAKKPSSNKPIATEDDDSKSIPPEGMKEVDAVSQIDKVDVEVRHEGDKQQDITQLHKQDEEDNKQVELANTHEDLNEEVQQEVVEDQEDQHETDEHKEGVDEVIDPTEDIAVMVDEGENLAPTHLRPASKDLEERSASSRAQSVYQETPMADSRLSDVKSAFGSRLEIYNKIDSLVKDVDELSSELLQRKFEKYDGQIIKLIEHYNSGASGEFVMLSNMQAFIPDLLNLIKVGLKYKDNEQLDESAVRKDLVEYVIEISTTELLVSQSNQNLENDTKLLDNHIDILTIFALIEKFVAVWQGECILIDKELNSSLNERELLPEVRSKLDQSEDMISELPIQVDRTPPKQVRNKIHDTIKQYEDLMKSLPPNDAAAIAYQEIINTLK